MNGINTPWLYFGCKNSLCAFHNEDNNLWSINFHLGGDPKIWWGVHEDHRPRLEQFLSQYPEHSEQCSSFLRHKHSFLNPFALKKFNITVYEHKQLPGDIVITNGLHQVGNLGFNINVAVNCQIAGIIRDKSYHQNMIKTSCNNDCSYSTKSLNMFVFTKYLRCDHKTKQYEYTSDNGIITHNKIRHHMKTRTQCIFCIKRPQKLLAHFKSYHLDQLPEALCTLCRGVFANFFSLKDHLRTCKKCKFCKKTFRSKAKAMSHHCESHINFKVALSSKK